MPTLDSNILVIQLQNALELSADKTAKSILVASKPPSEPQNN